MATIPTHFVLKRIDDGWTIWLDALEGIPTDLGDQAVMESWTVKDLLGHVAYWEENAAAEIRQQLGLSEKPVLADYHDRNAENAAAHKYDSYDHLWQWMVTAHMEMRELIEIQQPDFDTDWVDLDTYLHYPEHTAQILVWRRRMGM